MKRMNALISLCLLALLIGCGGPPKRLVVEKSVQRQVISEGRLAATPAPPLPESMTNRMVRVYGLQALQALGECNADKAMVLREYKAGDHPGE